jgi:hypothetical protein
VTSSSEQLKARLERIRTLLYRLARVKDAGVEAELIAQLTLESEAVSRLRAASTVNAAATGVSARTSPVECVPAARPIARVGARLRTGRRMARHG